MQKVLTGKCIVVGDNIDTDQIYPGRFLAITDPKEIGSHCLCGVSEDIAGNFPQGGFVVAGRNFGCGSSREHAPIALLNMGASAVLADLFARYCNPRCRVRNFAPTRRLHIAAEILGFALTVYAGRVYFCIRPY